MKTRVPQALFQEWEHVTLSLLWPCQVWHLGLAHLCFAIGVTSTVLPKQSVGPALLSATASEGQGQLTHSCDPGSALPIASGDQGHESRGHLPSASFPSHITAEGRLGQLSHTLTAGAGAGSPVPLPAGSALLYCPGKVQLRRANPALHQV